MAAPDDDDRPDPALMDAAGSAALDASGDGAAAVLGMLAERGQGRLAVDARSTALATSLDGKWACTRRGERLAILDAGGAAVAEHALPDAEADLVFAGLPTVLCAIVRGAQPQLVMWTAPDWTEAARLALAQPMRHAATTGPRFVMRSADWATIHLVRTLGRGVGAKPIDIGGGARPSSAVGLANDQVLFEIVDRVGERLEVWDATVPKPLHKLALPLPPGQRTLGPAAGHLWIARGEEVFVYRLSDGRPFRHNVGAKVEAVICHPASPVVIVVTAQGLVRLSCFAHAMSLVESPWKPACGIALALQVAGPDDITLLGCCHDDATPWRIPVGKPPVA